MTDTAADVAYQREWSDPYCRWPGDATAQLAAAPWRRVVAVGDSVAAGVREPVDGYRDMDGMDVGRLTTSLYLVPAAAIGISLIWLSEIPGPTELAGGAIALAGVILANTRPRHDLQPPLSAGQAASPGTKNGRRPAPTHTP